MDKSWDIARPMVDGDLYLLPMLPPREEGGRR